MPEDKSPYSQAADFADLPSALHYLWYTFHFLPNSFADQRTQQVLTSDCIKSCLLVSVNSAKVPVEDFCFNLTCRLCYNRFKSLKTSNAALLAYICYVFTKVRSTPKTDHSSVDETVLLGRFPLPSRKVIESCLQFYETRPKSVVKKTTASRSDSNLQVLQSTSCFNPFPREESSSKRVGPSLHPIDLRQRSRPAPNPMLNKYNTDLSNEEDVAAQIAFNNLGSVPGGYTGTSIRTPSRPVPRNSRSRSPPSSLQFSPPTIGANRPEASPDPSRRSRSRSGSPTLSQETCPLTYTYVPPSFSFSPSQPDSPLY
jgi:hypothetical protein